VVSPKFTVVIPTRERRDVLEKCLQTVLIQDYDNLQIIVSDNFSGDGTGEFVRSVNDRRLLYLNTGKRLSMSHNWEYALSHIGDEGWVTILGDDDGLLPGAFQNISALISETGANAIRSVNYHYSWPSRRGKEYGSLLVPLLSGFDVRDSKTWLRYLMSGQISSYQHLPMLYTGGFVSIAKLQSIKGGGGAYFKSCIPDIYSVVALASVLDRYVYSRDPVSINGTSSHSTGASYFSEPGKQKLTTQGTNPAKLFEAEENIPFHSDVPLNADGSYPTTTAGLVFESFMQTTALRSSNLDVTYAQQLELILTKAIESGTSPNTIEWGNLFATQHGLPFGNILARAKLQSGGRSKKNRFGPKTERYFAGNKNMPLRDVLEASAKAADLRSRTPGFIRFAEKLMRRSDFLEQDPTPESDLVSERDRQ
jgi:hypothetical protein